MWALVVTVPAEEAELAADVLWGLGVRAVEERSPAGTDGVVELWNRRTGERRELPATELFAALVAR